MRPHFIHISRKLVSKITAVAVALEMTGYRGSLSRPVNKKLPLMDSRILASASADLGFTFLITGFPSAMLATSALTWKSVIRFTMVA